MNEHFVFGIKMVIGSNVWREELEALPADDKAWIVANSVHVFVDTPLWIA